MRRMLLVGALAGLVLGAGACRKGGSDDGTGARSRLPGVDLVHKVVRVGALNDESGPAAGIGKPYAVGKRVLARRIAAGGSGLLPDGWKVELVERDHGYNPQQAVELFNEIEGDVLFIGTSFGTQNTLPLRPMLERDHLFAFPASLSSKMADFEFTPPVGTPYRLEAMRAMDWAVANAGGAANVKAGIVYQQDDYGADGLEGWAEAAGKHAVQLVSRQAVSPGQADYTAAVRSLKAAGANYVMLTTLPTGTAPILGKAGDLGYDPVWIGNTPAWSDGFFDPKVVPAARFRHFYWSTCLPYWGEDVPGMKAFLAAYEKYGRALSPPDFYILVSYAQGLVEVEAFRRALEAGDPSREGYRRALHTMTAFSPGGGLLPATNLKRFPYVTYTQARILRPVAATRTWEVVAPYATPAAWAERATDASTGAGGVEKPAPASEEAGASP